MPSGIIIKGIGGFYYVKTGDGIIECKARGVFRKDELTPLPGDSVEIAVADDTKKTGNIEEIHERKSCLVRPAVANVDQVAIVIAAKSPSPDFVLLDKLLITAELKGLDSIICINKVDLDENQYCDKIKAAYEKANYEIIPLSSKTNIGFRQLKDILRGKVTVFAGQSGVGKSTMLNKIMDSWIMKTGDISGKIERGKHTTRHAELVELDFGGYVVDTPGFSSFELVDIKHEELELYYPEFNRYLNTCRFTRCSHISEPGCNIKEALNQGLIDEERYTRYTQFYNLLKQQKDYRKSK